MTNEQIELFFELAKTQLIVTDTEEEWDSYIEGVTDTLYILQMKNDMNSLENRLLQMWRQRRVEGML